MEPVNALFQSLVAKPDQLIKRRGKLGLIKVKASLEEVKQWVAERMGKDQEVSSGSQDNPSGVFDTVLTGFRIRIDLMRIRIRIRIQHFF